MTNTKCRICGESNQNQVFDAKEMMFGTNDIFTYFQCSYCQCLQILDIPDNLSRFYSSDDYYSLNISVANLYKNKLKNTLKYLRDNYIIFWRNFLTSKILQNSQIYLFSNIPTLNKENSILDIGCGKGEMLYRLRNSGFRNLTGIDPNVDKDIIYDDNLKILKKDTVEIKEKFDIITMNHSLEHIPNQEKTLLDVKTLLNKNSYLIIRIPLCSSFACDNYKVDWVQLDAPRHLYLHSEKSFKYLVEKTGFTVKKVIYDSSEFQFMGSEQYKKNIPLHSAESYLNNMNLFDVKEIEDFKNKADSLNEEGRGDQAIFYLQIT